MLAGAAPPRLQAVHVSAAKEDHEVASLEHMTLKDRALLDPKDPKRVAGGAQSTHLEFVPAGSEEFLVILV